MAELGRNLEHALLLATVVAEVAEVVGAAAATEPEPTGAFGVAALAPRLVDLVAAHHPDGPQDEIARSRDAVRDALDRDCVALDPQAPGRVLEALLDQRARRRGSHYTPPDAVERLVHLVLDGAADERAVDGFGSGELAVCEPSCGGGSFLLAAADALLERGVSPERVVGGCLWGCDLDPLAVATSEAALGLWALRQGVLATPGAHLVTGDALTLELGSWPDAPGVGFDVVVGNPPFQAQLARATARPAGRLRAAGELEALRDPYTDTAALFLAHAVRLTRPGGRIGLIQPLSFLAAFDAQSVRQWVGERTTSLGHWVPGEQVFAANVRVIAPVLRREVGPAATTRTVEQERPSGPSAPVEVRTGTGDTPRQPPARRRRRGASAGADPLADPVFGALLAGMLSVPLAELNQAGTIGDLATATAGFRDEYYGLVPHVVEAPDGADGDEAWLPLVTCGLIDPVHNRWGEVAARFARRRFARPVLPVGALTELTPRVASWVAARRRPKVLVSTQTPVVEVVVDEGGALVPSVPVIAVHAAPSALWRLAAALSAPPVSALALARTAAASRSGGAVKLAARQVLDLPLPSDGDAWDRAADLLREASGAARRGDGTTWSRLLTAYGDAATAAFGVPADHQVVAWWRARLPAWR